MSIYCQDTFAEIKMKAYLQDKLGERKIPVEDFAEHILRNYSFKERAEFGITLIQQAYTVLCRNLNRGKGIET